MVSRGVQHGCLQISAQAHTVVCCVLLAFAQSSVQGLLTDCPRVALTGEPAFLEPQL